MAALRSARPASSRTHIKQAVIVSIATATFVHYAYTTLTAAIQRARLVAVHSSENLYGSACYLEG